MEIGLFLVLTPLIPTLKFFVLPEKVGVPQLIPRTCAWMVPFLPSTDQHSENEVAIRIYDYTHYAK